jgi:CheY-like chemotaxis protein
VATNGAKALELAKVEPLPDVILLDVMMPQMDEDKGHSRYLSDGKNRDR